MNGQAATRHTLALKGAGHSFKEIVRLTRHSRKLVRQTVRGARGNVFRVRRSSLDTYLPVLDAEWASGCRNGAELWRRLTTEASGIPARCQRMDSAALAMTTNFGPLVLMNSGPPSGS